MNLKIEFINDVPFRFGELWENQYFEKIDNWQNILSNKISALGRNEEKDLVDILFIAYKFPFEWKELIEQAKEKDTWVEEIKVAQYFADVEIISSIKWKMGKELEMRINDFQRMAKDVLSGGSNSLAGVR